MQRHDAHIIETILTQASHSQDTLFEEFPLNRDAVNQMTGKELVESISFALYETLRKENISKITLGLERIANTKKYLLTRVKADNKRNAEYLFKKVSDAYDLSRANDVQSLKSIELDITDFLKQNYL